MPKLLIAIVLLIVLIGGGIAGYALGLGPFAQFRGEPAAKETAEKIKPYFVEFDPVVVPVFDGDRVVAHVIMEIQLETENGNQLALNAAKPFLANAFLADLIDFMPEHLKARGELGTDYVLLKSRLQTICDRMLGPGMVRSILLQGGLDRVFVPFKRSESNKS